ncbi:unnamed protein product [Vitrella brassicaformis CCMP3155]|uniref:Dynein heavy chain n=6 Tax=Vitrella brassicaformis TaxID=1169539 RepID=A0A0G4FEQ2_VITBC|nr:unnamed protein product [Vitrella brassicaformis CCMP3155]|eukprot:CEM11721.1 unnamed protein product [Vitrella brassicaformis CCMP3155]
MKGAAAPNWSSGVDVDLAVQMLAKQKAPGTARLFTKGPRLDASLVTPQRPPPSVSPVSVWSTPRTTRTHDRNEPAVSFEGANAATPSDLESFIAGLLTTQDVLRCMAFVYVRRRRLRVPKYADVKHSPFIELPSHAYDVEVVSFQQLMRQSGGAGGVVAEPYTTISARGVVSYENNKPTEFDTLIDWLRHRAIFAKLTQIKLFKTFKRWKAFELWRLERARARTQEAAQSLEAKLFLLNPPFRDLLLRCRSLCLQVEDLRCLQTEMTSGELTLNEFAAIQHKHQERTTRQLHRKVAYLQHVTQTTFQSLLGALRQVSMQRAAEQLQQWKEEATDGIPLPSQQRRQQSPTQSTPLSQEALSWRPTLHLTAPTLSPLPPPEEAEDIAADSETSSPFIQGRRATLELTPIQRTGGLGWSVIRCEGDLLDLLGLPKDLSYWERAQLRQLSVQYIRVAYLIEFLVSAALVNLVAKSVEEFAAVFDIPPDLPSSPPIEPESDTIGIKAILQQVGRLMNLPESRPQQNKPTISPKTIHLYGRADQKTDRKQKIESPGAEVLGKMIKRDTSRRTHIAMTRSAESEAAETSPIFTVRVRAATEGGEGWERREGYVRKKAGFADPARPRAMPMDDQADKVDVPTGETSELSIRYPMPPTPTSLELDPPSNELVVALMTAVDEGVACVQVVPRFSQLPELKLFYQFLQDWDKHVGRGLDIPQEPPMIDVLPLLELHPQCPSNVAALATVTSEVYASISQFLRWYESLVDTCRANAATAEADEASILYGDSWLEDPEHRLKAWLQIFGGQVTEFWKIPWAQQIGPINLELHEMKLQLLPSPCTRLLRVHCLFPHLIRKNTHRIQEWCDATQGCLSVPPSTVGAFVRQMEYLGTAQMQVDDMQALLNQSYALITVMEEHNIFVEPSVRAGVTSAYESLRAVRTTMMFVWSSVARNTHRFAKDVSEYMPTVVKRLDAIASRISDVRYLTLQTLDGSFGVNQIAPEPQHLSEYLEKEDATEEGDITEKSRELEDMKQQVDSLKQECHEYQGYQEALRIKVTPITQHAPLADTIATKLKLWTGLADWLLIREKWSCVLLTEVDITALQEALHPLMLACSHAERQLPPCGPVAALKSRSGLLQSCCPLIDALSNRSLTDRHWEAIQQHVGTGFEPSSVSLMSVLQMVESGFLEAAAPIISIAHRATQESSLEDLLDRVERIWERRELPLVHYKSAGKETYILGSMDDIISCIHESFTLINTVASSRFMEALQDRLALWQTRIARMHDLIDKWLYCQKLWRFLDGLFAAAIDIQRQLIQEGKTFNHHDGVWRNLMKETLLVPLVLDRLEEQGLGEALEGMITAFEGVKKQLDDYVEMKRRAFPRFYFLSNEELLDILTKSRDPKGLQQHHKKWFAAVDRLDFGPEEDKIRSPTLFDTLGFISGEGETLPIIHVRFRFVLDEWLTTLADNMVRSLKRTLQRTLFGYGQPDRTAAGWMLSYQAPAQVISVASQILWCQSVERALTFQPSATTSVQEVLEGLNNALKQCEDSLVTLVRLLNEPLTMLQRLRVYALITADVHNRDVTQTLIAKQVTSASDFEWTKCLRYYWTSALPSVPPTPAPAHDDSHPVPLPVSLSIAPDHRTPASSIAMSTCVVEQLDHRICYGYEYMGVCSRLVLTPLTDRCWLTITQAFSLKLAACLTGPAGTGKTESVKDLAKAVGVPCLVFNCSDRLDHRTLGRLLNGLVQEGAWCCFDEFNRLDVEVMSVVSQQLLKIRQALLSGAGYCDFEDQRIKLRGSFGLSVTMNPPAAHGGTYGGRTELPDNLKAMLRPMAMMQPDSVLIVEVLLFSEGFMAATGLSKHMVTCVDILAHLLPRRKHYDWSLRALKAILKSAGEHKRKIRSVKGVGGMSGSSPPLSARSIGGASSEGGDGTRDEEEETFIWRAVMDVVFPVLHDTDVHIFHDVIRATFPHLKHTQATTGSESVGGSVVPKAMSHAIGKAFEALALQPEKEAVLKVEQLSQACRVRFGCMLIGPAGGGKSATWRVLAAAQNHLAAQQDPHAQPTHATRKTGTETQKKDQRSDDSSAESDVARGVQSLVVNPKSVLIQDMFGSLEPKSLEWRDGIVPLACRAMAAAGSRPLDRAFMGGALSLTGRGGKRDKAASVPAETVKWVVFDGPVDPLWIENMNTVLDDSMVLCLENSERIKLSAKTMGILFEVDELENASPATVSRCGMVYVAHTAHPDFWRPRLKSWLDTFLRPPAANNGGAPKEGSWIDPEIIEKFSQLLYAVVPHALDLWRTELHPHSVLCNEMQVLDTLLCLLESLLKPDPTNDPYPFPSSTIFDSSTLPQQQSAAHSDPPDPKRIVKRWGAGPGVGTFDKVRYLSTVFATALAWSLGGGLDAKRGLRKRVHDLCVDKVEKCVLPSYGSVFDFCVCWESESYVVPWLALASPPDLAAVANAQALTQVTVPTATSVCYTHMLKHFLDQQGDAGSHALLVGGAASGKTRTVGELVSEWRRGDTWQTMDTIMSWGSTPAHLVKTLEGGLTVQRKKGFHVLKPASKRQGIIWIEDVNLPKRDRFGYKPTLEGLRQIVDGGGVYAWNETAGTWGWKRIERLAVLATARALGGEGPLRMSEHPHYVPNRLLRHFKVVSMPLPGLNEVQEIFMPLLQHFFNKMHPKQPFMNTVLAQVATLVRATAVLFEGVVDRFKPTPLKFHYTYSLRDVRRVMDGLLLAHPETVANKDTLVRLWTHETTRTLRDPLMHQEETALFDDLLTPLLARLFQTPWRPSHGSPTDGEGHAVRFGSFLRPEVAARVYEEMAHSSVVNSVAHYLEEYNLSPQGRINPLRLVFFTNALDHLTRLIRIGTHAQGHALLLGPTGYGKKSLCRLAAFILRAKLFEPEGNVMLGVDPWRDVERRALKCAGVEGCESVLLVSDGHMVNLGDGEQEMVWEDVSRLLAGTGMVDLWTQDDVHSIVQSLHENVPEKVLDEYEDVHGRMKLFNQRVKRRLHLFICMSPTHPSLRQQCLHFPPLLSHCHKAWLDPWTHFDFHHVASARLANFKMPTDAVAVLQEGWRGHVARALVATHGSVVDKTSPHHDGGKDREGDAASAGHHWCVTAKDFLDTLATFHDLFMSRHDLIASRKGMLQQGLKQLRTGREGVLSLSGRLEALQPSLDAKKDDTAKLLKKMDENRAALSRLRGVVEQEAKDVQLYAEQVRVITDDAQSDLDEIMGDYERAERAVDRLDRKDIQELKSFQNPPSTVRLVVECVCMLLGYKEDWSTARQIMGDVNFVRRIFDYDKDHVPERLLQKLQTYLDDPQFDPQAVERQSQAAKSLCLWCRAIHHYAHVLKRVQPKRQRLEEQKARLHEAQDALEKKQSELSEMTERLGGLEALYDETQSDLERLREEKQIAERRLKRGQELTEVLSDEAVRWTDELRDLNTQVDTLLGDTIAATATLTYCGPFPQEMRDRLTTEWLQILRTHHVRAASNWTIRRSLSPAEYAQVCQWQLQGLPSDAASLTNSVIATQCRRWPLLIDPQGQGQSWYRSRDGARPISVKARAADIKAAITRALSEGRPLLVDDCEDPLPPLIYPLLNLCNTNHRPTAKEESGKERSTTYRSVRLGGQEVGVSSGFALALRCSQATPDFRPEIQTRVTVINFSVTHESLLEQLLTEVVRCEAPQMESRRLTVALELHSANSELKRLEHVTLDVMSDEREGNILDDEEVIGVMANAQATHLSLRQRLEETQKLSEELTLSRRPFIPLAERGATLYHVVSLLPRLDHMYRFSLAAVTKLFAETIRHVKERRQEGTPQEVRLMEAKGEVTRSIYQHVCRGLFERHRLPFSLLLCAHVYGQEQKAASPADRRNYTMTNAQWRFFIDVAQQITEQRTSAHGAKPSLSPFLRNAPPPAIELPDESPDPSIFPYVQWKAVTLLPTFFSNGWLRDVPLHVIFNTNRWKDALTKEDQRALKLLEMTAVTEPLSPWQQQQQQRGEPSSPTSTTDPFEQIGRICQAVGLVLPTTSPFPPDAATEISPAHVSALFEQLFLYALLFPAKLHGAVHCFLDRAFPSLMAMDGGDDGKEQSEEGEKAKGTEAGNGRRHESVTAQLEQMVGEATSREPLLLVFGPGADPTEALLALAEKLFPSSQPAEDKADVSASSHPQADEHPSADEPLWAVPTSAARATDQAEPLRKGLELVILSMGPGQEGKVDKVLAGFVDPKRKDDGADKRQRGRGEGPWVILQNLHLAPTGRSQMEKWIHRIQDPAQTPNLPASFRIFLTSLPTPGFPEPVILASRSLVIEPPHGLKEAFSGAAEAAVAESVWGDSLPAKRRGSIVGGMDAERKIKGAWRRVVMATCFLHAVLQERRHYGSLGFNFAYQFQASDLNASLLFLSKQSAAQTPPSLLSPSLVYAFRIVLSTLHYGGRLTDAIDTRCLASLVALVLQPKIVNLSDASSTSWLSLMPEVSSAVYCLPPLAELATWGVEEMRNMANKWPEADDPRLLGLHPNAALAIERSNTVGFLHSLASLQPSSEHGPFMTLSAEMHTHEQHDTEKTLVHAIRPSSIAALIQRVLDSLPAKIVLKVPTAPSAAAQSTEGSPRRRLSQKQLDDAKRDTQDTPSVAPSPRPFRKKRSTIIQKKASIVAERPRRQPSNASSSSLAADTSVAAGGIQKEDRRMWPRREGTTSFVNGLAVALLAEVDRYNSLLQLMSDSLHQALEALHGRTESLTEPIETLIDRIANQQLPKLWYSHSFPYPLHPPPSLASWLAALSARVSWISQWAALRDPQGTNLGYEPPSFWLGALFSPSRLVKAMVMTQAMRLQLPVERVQMHHTVTTTMAIAEHPSDGYFVHGLTLQGARWDPHTYQLEELRPRQLESTLPVVHISITSADASSLPLPISVTADSSMPDRFPQSSITGKSSRASLHGARRQPVAFASMASSVQRSEAESSTSRVKIATDTVAAMMDGRATATSGRRVTLVPPPAGLSPSPPVQRRKSIFTRGEQQPPHSPTPEEASSPTAALFEKAAKRRTSLAQSRHVQGRQSAVTFDEPPTPSPSQSPRPQLRKAAAPFAASRQASSISLAVSSIAYQSYECPVYTNTDKRETPVMMLPLPTAASDPLRWARRGVAIVLT